MCIGGSAPAATARPTLAKTKAPDQTTLFEGARQRAAQRGGGKTRSTVLGGLQGITTEANTAARRGRTALG